VADGGWGSSRMPCSAHMRTCAGGVRAAFVGDSRARERHRVVGFPAPPLPRNRAFPKANLKEVIVVCRS
jgi:hypothetical protein